jgi:DNA-binding transcriptional MerR regulator
MEQQVGELITLSEANQILKVHPNTLRKWDRKGIE